MVNYHVERGVKVTTYSTTAQATESKLTFSNASKRDEGNYTCSPSNSVPATVQLYVTRKSKFVSCSCCCLYLLIPIAFSTPRVESNGLFVHYVNININYIQFDKWLAAEKALGV